MTWFLGWLAISSLMSSSMVMVAVSSDDLSEEAKVWWRVGFAFLAMIIIWPFLLMSILLAKLIS